MNEIRKIKLDDIIPCHLIPERVDLGDEMQGLVDTIKIKGDVEIPIKVRPSKTKPGKYERIWGKRRQEACIIAGLKEVSCIVEDVNDDEAFRQSAIENIYHKDLNPIEEAKFFEAWSKRCNLNYNEIAGELGLDPNYVYHRTRLLELPQTIQDKIRTGANFTIHHGHLLIQVKDPDLQEKLADEVIEKNLTVRELEKKVKEITELKEEDKPEGLGPITVAHKEEITREPEKRIDLGQLKQKTKEEEPIEKTGPIETPNDVITKPEQFAQVVKSAPPGIIKEGDELAKQQRVFALAHELVKEMKDTGFVSWNDVIKALSPEERPPLDQILKFYDKKIFAYQFTNKCPACNREIIIKSFSYYPLDFKNTEFELAAKPISKKV